MNKYINLLSPGHHNCLDDCVYFGDHGLRESCGYDFVGTWQIDCWLFVNGLAGFCIIF